ncbi:RES family NAD+ phosphorylase [Maritimibacter sp. 55A14]|uniref:RES family NAD+ phosphorylase n=1 Tax=Maritimibacter sp. 55A14 TaxID=2174844 RepID=UPI001304FB15|nr:RES family NAD+ phosphorylase [Maritimibacter sp. 55A14]
MPRPELPCGPYRGNLWRMIEGQSKLSTMRIVDTNAEQDLLEHLLEEAKPPVPVPCRHLDYRLWSPFRYGRYPRDSRFRRAGQTPGVWYGAEHVLTAMIEAAWGALRFFAASPGTPMPRRPVEHTAVQADIRTPRALDLTAPEMSGQGCWTDPEDYADCLAVAERLHAEEGGAIRYASVRDPLHRANVAVLDCAAFAQPAPIALQTWHLLLSPVSVRAHCETLRQRHMFRVGETGLIAAD